MLKRHYKRTPFVVLAKEQRVKKNRVKYSLFMTVFPSSARSTRTKRRLRCLNELTSAALSFAL